MTSFTSVEIESGGTGLLHFKGDATNAIGGYAVFKTGNGHLTFQGGSNGFMYVNQASNAILSTMLGDGSVTFWAPPTAGAVLFNLKAVSGNQLGIYTSTSTGDTRIKSRGYLTLHAGHAEYTAAREMVRLVSDAPTASDTRVEIRSTGTPPAGPGTAMLVFRTAEGVSESNPGPDRLGIYVNTVDGETRIAAHGQLAFSAGSAAYSGTHEVLRILTNGNVRIGTDVQGGKLDVKVGAGSREAINLVAGGNGGGDLPTVSWKNAAGSLLTTQFADGASGHMRLKSSGMLAFHTGPLTEGNRWGDANERMTISTTGNVGIGTNAPAAPLQVGDVTLERPGTVRLASKYQAGNRAWEIGTDGSPSGWNYGFAIRDLGAGAGATRLVVDLTGSVGIGTATPGAGYKLDVAGQVNASTGFTVGGQCFVGGAGTPGRISSNDFRFLDSGDSPGLFNNAGTKRLVGNAGCYYA